MFSTPILKNTFYYITKWNTSYDLFPSSFNHNDIIICCVLFCNTAVRSFMQQLISIQYI